MALISCPDCNKDVSDKSTACIHCGCPLGQKSFVNSVESKVIVYGYTESFLTSPSIYLFVAGVEVGKVDKGEHLEILIRKETEIVFKCGFRKASIIVPYGKVTKVKLSWDRVSGKIVPKIVDFII